MKHLLFTTIVMSFVLYSNAQFVYKIKADSVLITNDSCTAELILENSTKDIKGFLYNRGKGRTEFRTALTRINDSTYQVGDDTLRLFSGGVPSNAWHLDGNASTNPPADFLGTTDNNRLAIKTDNTERMTVLANGRILLNTTTDQGNYTLQVNGRAWIGKEMLVNNVTVGTGSGTYLIPSNTTVGNSALANNTTGLQITAVGFNSLNDNTTGNYNTAIGASCLESNTTGSNNTAVGYTSLSSNTTGEYNSALGRGALGFNTTGNRNTASGFAALSANTTGSNNTSSGDQALVTNTTGDNNTAIGGRSLTNNTTGYNNTAAGSQSLFNNKASAGNTAVGTESLKYDSTGNNNVAIGYLAGGNLGSGDNNIFIGYNTVPNISTSSSNQLNIGNWIYGDNGNIGINVTAPTAKAHLAAGTASANTAPLKFTSGTNLTTPENGAVEYNGTNYFATSGGTRYTLAKTLTATSTLNFPGTVSQSTSDLTVTVTGAADGDAVSLGIPNAAINANSSYMAWVSAADTVTIRFTNDSAGSIDPASAIFRVSIVKY